MLDFVYRKDKNYYTQVFSEKNNFIVIEKKMRNFKNDIEIYSDDSYNANSDEKYSNDSDGSDKENSDGKIRMKKIKRINLFLDKLRKI